MVSDKNQGDYHKGCGIICSEMSAVRYEEVRFISVMIDSFRSL
jgi:hypothetical protein